MISDVNHTCDVKAKECWIYVGYVHVGSLFICFIQTPKFFNLLGASSEQGMTILMLRYAATMEVDNQVVEALATLGEAFKG